MAIKTDDRAHVHMIFAPDRNEDIDVAVAQLSRSVLPGKANVRLEDTCHAIKPELPYSELSANLSPHHRHCRTCYAMSVSHEIFDTTP